MLPPLRRSSMHSRMPRLILQTMRQSRPASSNSHTRRPPHMLCNVYFTSRVVLPGGLTQDIVAFGGGEIGLHRAVKVVLWHDRTKGALHVVVDDFEGVDVGGVDPAESIC